MYKLNVRQGREIVLIGIFYVDIICVCQMSRYRDTNEREVSS